MCILWFMFEHFEWYYYAGTNGGFTFSVQALSVGVCTGRGEADGGCVHTL